MFKANPANTDGKFIRQEAAEVLLFALTILKIYQSQIYRKPVCTLQTGFFYFLLFFLEFFSIRDLFSQKEF